MIIKKELFNKLFILDIANSHQGNVEKGLEIIHSFYKIIKKYPQFKFAIKFQYRDTFNSFIHPEYKKSFEFKYIKRFTETFLYPEQYLTLVNNAKELGFLIGITAFDEISVDVAVDHKCDFLKIASCSAGDWPLLQKISLTDLPVIISLAGTPLNEIDNIYNFFKNRKKEICFLHCVAEYPTQKNNLQLNQIDFLKEKFIDIPIGYSSHEEPDNYESIKIAIGKNAKVFEKHIDLDCDTKNNYSCIPGQINTWLQSVVESYELCGTENKRYEFSEKEKESLSGLRRGAFINKNIDKGQKIKIEDVFFAIPLLNENHLSANNFSKYLKYTTTENIQKNKAITLNNVSVINTKDNILDIGKNIIKFIKKNNVPLPDTIKLSLSHHYGIEKFYEYGIAIIDIINMEYCKKILIMLPKQKHPSHIHKIKKETFNVLYGKFTVNLNNKKIDLSIGDILTVEKEMSHSFETDEGVIFEEISTKHIPSDSYYEDEFIMNNFNDRKTEIIVRKEWYEQI